MTAIIEYGVGNLFSLCSSLEFIGQKAIVTDDPTIIDSAERVILPGVGAFELAAQKLHARGMDEVVRRQAAGGKPLLGICLGMQMLLERSFEYGTHEGLGLIPGDVVSMEPVVPEGFKVPHIGWNALNIKKQSELLKYINEGDHVYFVHSFYGTNCAEFTVATTDYGAELTAIVQRDNVYGTQFHPEKSGDVGMHILKAFCEMK